MMEKIVFGLLAGTAVLSALLVVTMKNVFHAALLLIVALLGVGGLYAMLAADFLFAVQLLVYAGGVMVILLFVVLLSGKPSDWSVPQMNEKALGAGVFSALFFAIIVAVLRTWPMSAETAPARPTTGELGTLFLTEMLLPFEVISLVLVAALVGAIFFSSRKSS